MAIEFFDGFETGTLENGRWMNPGSMFIFNGGRNGSFRFASNGNSNNSTWLTLPATAKKTIGMAYSSGAGAGWGGGSQFAFQIGSDVGATPHISLTFDTFGHMQARRGAANGTLLATSTQIFTTGVYHYIECQATIDDVTGTCIVKVDNVEWINFTGDTRNAGTSALIDHVRFWTQTNVGSEPSIDDLYVTNGTDDTAVTGRPDNGFLGDIKVEALYPNNNGAVNQWLGSDGNSVDNYLLVDEVGTPSATDYTGTVTDGQRDLYDLTNVSATTQAVLAIRPNAYAAKSDAGSAAIKMLIRESSGTVTAEGAQALSTGYQFYYGTLRTTKPSGGAWTVAEANALQIGVEKAP